MTSQPEHENTSRRATKKPATKPPPTPSPAPMPAPWYDGPRVVVFIQENKTTDFYFPTMAAWGADVAAHPAHGPPELRPAT